ncbi:YbaB/EbfC family nucleoid-associated protein [Saccharopolyspora sp. K220]|uniref:YbaB/EbfC family nucleoid-associated protein n=1 Tax=Saccharopolyspora soli TaxID=2926618 RepID=UPI001F562AB9|nr:YbaB/EbfC family nucleoid-associated protein [Saccharopolyspora soli]MCI2418638.1 YbaB/EbfC family nucleoid-associated protein [Saccharopolyspora soli]
MNDRTTEQWLASLQTQAESMIQQSEQLQVQLAAMTETASANGVRLTVNANGALQELEISREAMQRGPTELRNTILRLNGTAQGSVAQRVAQAVEPVAGADAMQFLRSRITEAEETAAASPAAPTPAQRPAPQQAPRRGAADYDDFDDDMPQTFLR